MYDIALGRSGLNISRMGLGCMGMSSAYGASNPDACLETLAQALDLGVTFFDTADMYGWGENERLIGTFLKRRRDEVVIATKCGITRGASPLEQGRDTSPAYIRQACHTSLQRLGTDHIDLYYLHRLDGVTPLEDSMGALADLVSEGKIRAVGLSEVSAATLAKANALFPVSAVQNEYSLATRGGEVEAVIDTCGDLGVSFVPYSPISRGLLTGVYRAREQFGEGDFRAVLPRFAEAAIVENLRMVDQISALAAARGATAVQMVLAWVLARAPHIAPIPGTRQVSRLQENLGAVDLVLTPDEIASLEAALPADGVAGRRYPEALDRGLA